MPSFTQLFTLAVLAAVGSAAHGAGRAHCSDAKLVHNVTIPVGDKHILYTSFSCSATTTHTRRGLLDPILCILLGIDCPPKTPPPPPPQPPRNVCDASCTTSCSNVTGVLPPISDDCQTVADSVQILQGQLPNGFTVAPQHLETLSFGTCSYFFENLGTDTLEYCWPDFATEGNAAAAACFPPVQPFFPEGLCTAYDSSWAVGATHS